MMQLEHVEAPPSPGLRDKFVGLFSAEQKLTNEIHDLTHAALTEGRTYLQHLPGDATTPISEMPLSAKLLVATSMALDVVDNASLQHSIWQNNDAALPRGMSKSDNHRASMDLIFSAHEARPDAVTGAIKKLLLLTLGGANIHPGKALRPVDQINDMTTRYETPLTSTVFLQVVATVPDNTKHPDPHMKHGVFQLSLSIHDNQQRLFARVESVAQAEREETLKSLSWSALRTYLIAHDHNAEEFMISREIPLGFHTPAYMIKEFLAIYGEEYKLPGFTFSDGEQTKISLKDKRNTYRLLFVIWQRDQPTLAIEIFPTQDFKRKRRKEIWVQVHKRVPEILKRDLLKTTPEIPLVYRNKKGIVPQFTVVRGTPEGPRSYPKNMVRLEARKLLKPPPEIAKAAMGYDGKELYSTIHETRVRLSPHGEEIPLLWQLQKDGKNGKRKPVAKIVCWTGTLPENDDAGWREILED